MVVLQRMNYREIRIGVERLVKEVVVVLQLRYGGGMDQRIDEDVKKWFGVEKYLLYLLRIGCDERKRILV